MNGDLIWTWFIDPYLRQAHILKVAKKLSAWHEAIQSDCLDSGRLSNRGSSGHYIDVWVDDWGQLRNPPLATFALEGRMFYGYGLIFECDSAGETLPVSFSADFLKDMLCLSFDASWEKRLKVADYFPQLTRIVKWEKWHSAVGATFKQGI